MYAAISIVILMLVGGGYDTSRGVAATEPCHCEKNAVLFCSQLADRISIRSMPCARTSLVLVYLGDHLCFARDLLVSRYYFYLTVKNKNLNHT